MNQEEILDFFKQNKGKWFNYKQLKQIFNNDFNRQPLLRLVRWGFIKTKCKRDIIKVYYCDRKPTVTGKLITYYAYKGDENETKKE